MTAEIAILNRTAVALAADSAITLGGTGTNAGLSKTYLSAEKIFQLSRYQPIALMIYNNAQFMNAPLEVIIRHYRERLTVNQFKNIVQVWPEFEKFLLDFKRERVDELDHLALIAAPILSQIRLQSISYVFNSYGRRRSKNQETVEEFALRKIRERRDEALESPLEGFLDDKTLEDFKGEYGEAISELSKRSLPFELSNEIEYAIYEMVFSVVKSTERTEAYTGLVFSGFGSDEIFPTLDSLEIDGLYFGQFRVLSHQTIDIDRRGDTAAIVPFAQQDMPQRFMFGIDNDLEGAIQSIADDLVSQIVDQNRRVFKGEKAGLVKQAASDQFRKGLDSLKRKSSESLNDVVDHLSKKELGEFAYSLVELTTWKRRYSSDAETVGGPIDVAILTRNEGFIWVKRKHYFDTTINPQYVKQTLR